MHLTKVTYIYILSGLAFPWNRTHDIAIASAKHHDTTLVSFLAMYHGTTKSILDMHHFVFTIPQYIFVKVACMHTNPDECIYIKTCPHVCLS